MLLSCNHQKNNILFLLFLILGVQVKGDNLREEDRLMVNSNIIFYFISFKKEFMLLMKILL